MVKISSHLFTGTGVFDTGFYGSGNGSKFINNVNCNKTAKNITECAYDLSSGVMDCNDVGVACKG